LTEAGYPDGFQVDLITSTAAPGMVELAEAVQEQIAPIGIAINVIRVPADAYWDNYWIKTPFHVSSWSFRSSIDETFELAHHSMSAWNESGWHSQRVDTIIEEARAEADVEQRKALYHEAQEIIMNEGGVVIPYFHPIIMVMHRHVQGLIPHPSGLLNLQDIRTL